MASQSCLVPDEKAEKNVEEAELEVDAGSLQQMAMYTKVQWQASLVYQTNKLRKQLKQPQY
jgi:hypothetical protein